MKWSGGGSNSRPRHCERRALPTELPPQSPHRCASGAIVPPMNSEVGRGGKWKPAPGRSWRAAADRCPQSGEPGVGFPAIVLLILDSQVARTGWEGRMRWAAWVAGLVALAAVFAGCGHEQAPAGGGIPLKVVVTIAPLKGLVEPLLPEGSTVTVLMQPGKSEHGYEFTPGDVAAMAKADLFVYVGLGLEGRIEAAAKRQASADHQVLCFADA